MSLPIAILPMLEAANRLFAYDEKTGRITRKASCGGQRSGTRAGCLRRDGYLDVGLCGHRVLCHRLGWMLKMQDEPPAEIDHINGCKSDNRFVNLRAITRQHNNQNRRKPYSNNKLGVMGVTLIRSGRYLARIRMGGKAKHIGVYDTVDEASSAYLSARRQMLKGNTL